VMSACDYDLAELRKLVQTTVIVSTLGVDGVDCEL
jgi:hypothetical protein